MLCTCESRSTSTKLPTRQAGDICYVTTSVQVPFMQNILRGMASAVPGAKAEAHRYYKNLIRPTKSVKGPRPCVVLPPRIGVKDQEICLMATFENKDPSSNSFPKMYREFVVPMLPNPGTGDYPDPLDSCPRWCGKFNQWIIATSMKPIRGTAQDLPLWMESSSGNGFHLCEEMFTHLVDTCRENTIAWEIKAKKSNIAYEYFKNLKAANDVKSGGNSARGTNASSSESWGYTQSSIASVTSSFLSGNSPRLQGLFAKNSPEQVGPVSSQQHYFVPPSNSVKQPGISEIMELQVEFKNVGITQPVRPASGKSRSIISIRASLRGILSATSIGDAPKDDGWTQKVILNLSVWKFAHDFISTFLARSNQREGMPVQLRKGRQQT
ncbi:hypothetical protein C8R43DRAFT_1106886 [Mycena crocata]|nr:hypothetical protein C8R43DRAFT_1106886 [Mycena crocata]